MQSTLDMAMNERTSWRDWLPVGFGLLVLYVPTFYDLSATLWQQDDHVHGPIILATLIWLIWSKRGLLLTGSPRTAPASGFGLLLVGLLLYAIGRSQGITLFEVGALAPILAGVLLAARGWSTLRSFWFPILFVAFLAPLPGLVVDALTGPLKQHVSEIAEQLLFSAGYPVARNGVVLTVGQYQLLVADACSGLNSMFTLSALGLLYAYLVGYKSVLHNALLVIAILPIAFCTNIVRVLILVLITYHFGDAAGQGFTHGFSGLMLFVTALLILFAFDGLIQVTAAGFRKARRP